MKHEVSRKKTISPLPRKGFSAPKEAVKKASEDVVIKPRKADSGKSVSVKSKPINAAKNTESKAVISTKKIVAKPVKITISSKKTVPSATKSKTIALKQNLKSKTEKIAPKTTGKTIKVSVQKTKPTIGAKQKPVAKTASAKFKLKTAKIIEKPKSGKITPKNLIAKSAKKIAPAKTQTLKIPAAKIKVQTAKIEKVKVVEPNKIAGKVQKKNNAVSAKKISAPKIKATTAPKTNTQKMLKLKPESGKKVVPKVQTLKPSVKTKNVAQVAQKTKLSTSVKQNKRLPKLEKTIVTKPKTSPKSVKINAPIAPKIYKPRERKIEKESSIKIRNGRLVMPPLLKKVKPVEVPIEPIVLTTPKPRKRKVKVFGAAIFRGKKARYDFQVFPVDGEFEDAAAIYIISRRVVDKRQRAHHKMVCIGQTNSIFSELKKHLKGKCFKQFQANAISVLREENEQKRLKIEADLKSAHTIPCPHA